MKIIDVCYTFDREQLIFRFIADDRVDFRQLAKDLGGIFKTRIELRQVGIRDKAKEIGGIGPCGRELCCATWMTNFVSVSTSAARYQDISLIIMPLAVVNEDGMSSYILSLSLETRLRTHLTLFFGLS